MTSNLLRTKLLDAYEHAGAPIATIYVPTRSDTENAEQRLEIHRDNIERSLREAGATEAMTALVKANLAELDHASGAAHLIVATDEAIIMSASLERPLNEARTWLESTPMLVPLIGATQADYVHVAALIDRSGADVMLRSGVQAPLDTIEVDGPYKRLHRSAPGGWSQKRFQQTAENAWELNAREVIDAIISDYPDVDLIICGGDERAVGFFTSHLPERIEAVVVAGSRHADADAFLDEADVALRDIAATEQVAVLDNFRTALGADNAVKGSDVIDMLVQGRVSDLLVVDNSMSAAEPPMIDFDFASSTRSGDQPVNAPLAETAVALAVGSGATVHVVADTSDTSDGIAAILRF